MACPGGDEPVVQRCRLLRRLIAGGVVLRGVEFLRPLGRRHKMEHRVVAAAELILVGSDVLQHLGEFPLVHIRPVVHDAPVAHDQDPVRGHGGGGSFKDPLLFQLQTHLAFLVIRVGAAGPGGHAACDQLRGGLRHDEDRPTLLCKRVPDPAQAGGLSRARPAGDHDLDNGHENRPFRAENSRALPGRGGLFLPASSIILPAGAHCKMPGPAEGKRFPSPAPQVSLFAAFQPPPGMV